MGDISESFQVKMVLKQDKVMDYHRSYIQLAFGQNNLNLLADE